MSSTEQQHIHIAVQSKAGLFISLVFVSLHDFSMTAELKQQHKQRQNHRHSPPYTLFHTDTHTAHPYALFKEPECAPLTLQCSSSERLWVGCITEWYFGGPHTSVCEEQPLASLKRTCLSSGLMCMKAWRPKTIRTHSHTWYAYSQGCSHKAPNP